MQIVESKVPVLVISFRNGEIHCCHLDGYRDQTEAVMQRLSKIEHNHSLWRCHMALHDVREAAIALALGQPRTVKFDLNAFTEPEDIYGSMDKVFAVLQTGSMKAARTLLWAGLLHEDESLSEKQVGKLVTMDNMETVMDVISKALLGAAGATDLFAEVQGMANTAWEENTALAMEAGQRYDTTESQLTMLKNVANNLAIQFSKVMIPVMMRVVEKLRGLIEWFKGLFSFEWKLPSFKLPKIDVTWNDIGWGIKLPKPSLNWNAAGGIFDKPTIFTTPNSGLQGVGEAGPEAILPLNTLWTEMSARLKSGMREILVEMIAPGRIGKILCCNPLCPPCVCRAAATPARPSRSPSTSTPMRPAMPDSSGKPHVTSGRLRGRWGEPLLWQSGYAILAL